MMATTAVCNGSPGPFTDQQRELVSHIITGRASHPPNIKHTLAVCSRDEIELIEAACRDVFASKDKVLLPLNLCCDELKACSGFPEKELRKIKLEQRLENVHTCSAFPTQVLDQRADFVDLLLPIFKGKQFSKDDSKFFSTCTPKMEEVFKEACDKFDAKNADKKTAGYYICCKTLDNCTDPFYTQTWFFAVCGGVGLLLIGIIGVVVYFFCIRKKRGGGSGGGGMASSKKSTKKSKK
ncbi:hypothetical protein B9Z55_008029 [Caenorhabditis nigoni]|uniref:Uncharacterized protein n=1 Tax=Caenorhabditis nigoni TaxID=1611254 RepID=A0A2G5VCA6_9PELO|nr:hypothetical protein B9Z55_008029 [Caenorhabditis nigoni]